MGKLTLHGYRANYSRTIEDVLSQPYDLQIRNIDERPQWATPNLFFFGSYSEDGSLICMDKSTGAIFRCKSDSDLHLYDWVSFDDFLEKEIDRICSQFDDNGEQINREKTTLPCKSFWCLHSQRIKNIL